MPRRLAFRYGHFLQFSRSRTYIYGSVNVLIVLLRVIAQHFFSLSPPSPPACVQVINAGESPDQCAHAQWRTLHRRCEIE